MNLAQLRLMVRDNLSAGGGENTVLSTDPFWSDAEVNTYINRAYRKVVAAMRRARAEHFMRTINSADTASVTILGQTYSPISLMMRSGIGQYTLPPDFVRLIGLYDARTNPLVKFTASSVVDPKFKHLYNLGSLQSSNIIFDIVGTRSIIVRPKPMEDFDVTLLYERTLPILRDYSEGTAETTNGSSIVTLSGIDRTKLAVGDEFMLGSASNLPTISVSETYDVVSAVSTVADFISLSSLFNSGNVGFRYLISSVPEIPFDYIDALVYYATYQGFSKGTNPNQESAASYLSDFREVMKDLISDIEIRQYQDPLFSEAYLEDD